MSIYVIADLHLSFNEPKPMSIFGNNWENHEEKIRNDWEKTVSNDDTVLLLGDFSWAMHLKDTLKDFEYINSLPGKKIMLRGNHDYWWTTKKRMEQFLQENNIKNVQFLQNNSIDIENKIICGTRGWTLANPETENSRKMISRECIRLELSIQDAISKCKENQEIIVCMHYPPILKANLINNEINDFIRILKKYNIKKCFYGHLHGTSINDAVRDNVLGINFELVSADGLDFKLLKLEN